MSIYVCVYLYTSALRLLALRGLGALRVRRESLRVPVNIQETVNWFSNSLLKNVVHVRLVLNLELGKKIKFMIKGICLILNVMSI